jgi:tetratricopeptide (TPR) repeat protein
MGEGFDRIAQAIALMDAETPDPAIRILDTLLVDEPAHHQALFVKGEAMRQAGRLPQAEATLLHSLLLVPAANGEILYRLGLTRLELGEAEMAERTFLEAAKQMPDNADLWATLGQLALRRDNLALAEDALRRASKLAPDDAGIKAVLADCLARRWPDGGLTLELEAMAEAEPHRPELLEKLVRIYLDQGQPDLAEQFVSGMVRRYPDNPQWHYAWGWLLRLFGRFDEAMPPQLAAMLLRPDDPEYLGHLGQNLLKLERTREAEQAFAWALKIEPFSTNATLGLASAHLEAGRAGEAKALIEEFDRAIQFPRGAERSIVIPILDYSPGSPYNIRTLLEDLRDFPGEVICIFNSQDVFRDLQDHPRIDKYALNKFNAGVARSWNMGINQAEGKVIHILNADLKISLGMLQRLEDWLMQLPDALCVGVSGHWVDPFTLKEIRALTSGGFTEPEETDMVSGQVFSLHAGRLHDAGISFDPRLSPYFGEETDLFIKARCAGLKIYAVPEHEFDHAWGISLRDRPIYCFGRQVHRGHCMVDNNILLQGKAQRLLPKLS